MQKYYNKVSCKAALIIKLKIDNNNIFCFKLDDGQEYEAYNGPDETTGKIKLINSHILYTLTHKKVDEYKWVDIPCSKWTVLSVPSYLVERYDMETDNIRVAVVEHGTFQSNFYLDESEDLIEMRSFEKPNQQRIGRIIHG